MGLRSQIYVRADGRLIIANYYEWNYGTRMISRARWGIEYLKEHIKYGWAFRDSAYVTRMSRVFDTNFDMHDVALSCDIIKERNEQFPDIGLNDYLFRDQDNNDGQLLVDVNTAAGTIKYAFIEEGGTEPMDGNEYMCWDDNDKSWDKNSADYIKTCKENIAALSSLAQLMTPEEIVEFVSADYEEKPF